MRKTGTQVQGDVIALLSRSLLAGLVNGQIYRAGYRPRDSRLEDIVVTFTAGLAEQRQTGVVTVNIYVPDVDPWDNGVLVSDGERCAEIEAAAQRWVDSLTAAVSDYRFTLSQTIATYEDGDTAQHFVSVRLKYEIIDL